MLDPCTRTGRISWNIRQFSRMKAVTNVYYSYSSESVSCHFLYIIHTFTKKKFHCILSNRIATSKANKVFADTDNSKKHATENLLDRIIKSYLLTKRTTDLNESSVA